MTSHTLLSAVNNILSEMDSGEVNSTNDTIESRQVKGILSSVWMEMQTVREVKSTEKTVFNENVIGKWDSLNEVALNIPSNTTRIHDVWFVKQPYQFVGRRQLQFMHQEQFLTKQFLLETSHDVVNTFNIADLALPVYNDRMPKYYTVFEQKYILFDSYFADPQDYNGYVGTIPPMFAQIKFLQDPGFPTLDTDNFEPLNPKMENLLIMRAKLRSFGTVKQLGNPDLERQVQRAERWLSKEQGISDENKPYIPSYGRIPKKATTYRNNRR